MKRLISFAIVIVVAMGAFLAMYHYSNGTHKDVSQAETVTTTTATEVVTLPEITPEPIVLEVTYEPTMEEVTIEVDPVTGKTYYMASSREAVLDYIRMNVSASTAVDSIECVSYAASMVVDVNDPRIVSGITAYDLVSDNNLVVYFDRNGGSLFAWSADKSFELSADSSKRMKTFADSKAYSSWICSEHMAVKSSVLIYGGYPNTANYRGSFNTANGFDLRVLKSVVLIDSGEGRYDWVLAVCSDELRGGDSDPEVPGDPPTVTPTAGPTQAPTQGPTQAPTQEPTQTPTQEPTQAPTKEPTQAPTQEPTQAPTQEPTQTPTTRPTVRPTSTPENNPRPTARPTARPTVNPTPENNLRPTMRPTKAPTANPEGENNGRPSIDSSNSGESSGRPSMGGGSSENTGYGNVSGDVDPFK